MFDPNSKTIRVAGPLAFFAGGAFLLAFLVPNHYPPWAAFYNEFSAFVALLLLGSHTILTGNRYRLSYLGLGLLALALVPWLQHGAGLVQFRGDALMASLYLVGAAAALLVGRSYGRVAEPVLVLATLLVVAALLSTMLALMQWLDVGGSIWVVDLRPGGRPYANLAQPNNLASLLCMGLAALLYLWERRTLGWQVATLAGTSMVFALALTQSRTPWVISLAFVGWCWWQRRRGALRLRPIYPLLWLGLYIGFVLFLPYLAGMSDLSASDAVSRAQRVGRLGLWQQLWHAITEGGLWGHGWNQVSTAQLAAALTHPVPMQTEYSHNIALDVLIWNGPVLGSAIILLTAGWLIRLYLRARSLESSFCLMAVGAILVHGLLEYPLAYAYFLLPACLLLGLVESDQEAPSLGGVPRSATLPALLGGVLASSLVWTEYRHLEEDFRLMRFQTARIGRSAVLTNPPSETALLNHVSEYIRFARTPAVEGLSDAELAWMEKVSSRFPHPPSLTRYGLALAINGKPEEARQVFRRLLGLHGEEHYRELKADLEAMRETYPGLKALP